MNSNRRVLLLVLCTTGLLLIFSLLGAWLHLDWLPLQRVSLIADLVRVSEDTTSTAQLPRDSSTAPVIIDQRPAQAFDLYQAPRRINAFYTDSNRVSLPSFAGKLAQLKKNGTGKIRIAYFGDSMIEGDLLTQTLRKLLQQAFGGSGVGFVPITSQVARFRQTVSANYNTGWNDDNFKEGKNPRLYLSGHAFHTPGAYVQMTDQTVTDSMAILEKSLIYGGTGGNQVRVNQQPVTLTAGAAVSRQVLARDGSRTIRLDVSDESLPVYGLSFESPSGIFVDNFSFRGITGIEYARIDSSFLAAVNTANPYDLIIFQYGVNLLFRPNDKDFNWYARAMMPVVTKIRGAFPQAEFVLVSTADRAFRYNGEYASAVGIDSLVKVQATLAYETGSAFYNQYASMGGKNSIVDWAKRKPSLANQDYVHPNHRGAEILGTWFFQALVDDYNRYLHSTTKQP